MHDGATQFRQLRLGNAALMEFIIIPLKKISTTLMAFPGQSDASAAGAIYDIQFNKVIDFSVDLRALRCRVVTQEVYPASAFLLQSMSSCTKVPRRIERDKLRHFRLCFDRGQIDVIAEDCSVNLIWEAGVSDRESSNIAPTAAG